MPEPKRHRWLPEEDKVVDRFARALAAGRFPSMLAACRACLKALGAQRAQSRPESHLRAAARVETSLESVRDHMQGRANALHLVLASGYLTPGEARIVDRHAQALLRGRYRGARQAAEACLPQFARLRGGATATRERTLLSVQQHIYQCCLRTGHVWSHTAWRPEEDRVVERHVRALARSRHPNILAAARACRGELHRSGMYGRSLAAVRVRVLERAHALGLPVLRPWSRDEMHVIDRYVRALYEGRYRFAPAAAAACASELAERSSRAGRCVAGRCRPRSIAAVHDVLSRRASSLRLPRYKTDLSQEELALIEQYARGVDRGEYQSWAEAARACSVELQRVYAAAARRSPLPVGKVTGHSPATVLIKMLTLSRQLGLRGPRLHLWSAAEIRALDSWLQWYERRRGSRRQKGLLHQAAEGLQEEIEDLNSHRTLGACEDKLLRWRRRLHGLT